MRSISKNKKHLRSYYAPGWYKASKRTAPALMTAVHAWVPVGHYDAIKAQRLLNVEALIAQCLLNVEALSHVFVKRVCHHTHHITHATLISKSNWKWSVKQNESSDITAFTSLDTPSPFRSMLSLRLELLFRSLLLSRLLQLASSFVRSLIISLVRLFVRLIGLRMD